MEPVQEYVTRGAEQASSVPPLDPSQVQVYEEEPVETPEASPESQRSEEEGGEETETPSASPQTPCMTQAEPVHEYPESQRY